MTREVGAGNLMSDQNLREGKKWTLLVMAILLMMWTAWRLGAVWLAGTCPHPSLGLWIMICWLVSSTIGGDDFSSGLMRGGLGEEICPVLK